MFAEGGQISASKNATKDVWYSLESKGARDRSRGNIAVQGSSVQASQSYNATRIYDLAGYSDVDLFFAQFKLAERPPATILVQSRHARSP